MTQLKAETVILNDDEIALYAISENDRLHYMEAQLANMCAFVRKRNEKWWHDLHTNEPLQRNVGEMLMLVVSEIAEGMEGHRKNLMDDKIPDRPMLEVELADAVIRIMDIAGGLNLDLAGAWRDKMVFNSIRKDHSVEARKAENGKKY